MFCLYSVLWIVCWCLYCIFVHMICIVDIVCLAYIVYFVYILCIVDIVDIVHVCFVQTVVQKDFQCLVICVVILDYMIILWQWSVKLYAIFISVCTIMWCIRMCDHFVVNVIWSFSLFDLKYSVRQSWSQKVPKKLWILKYLVQYEFILEKIMA